jgi:hypothetical protein
MCVTFLGVRVKCKSDSCLNVLVVFPTAKLQPVVKAVTEKEKTRIDS